MNERKGPCAVREGLVEEEQMKSNATVKVRLYSFSYPKGIPADETGHGAQLVIVTDTLWRMGRK